MSNSKSEITFSDILLRPQFSEVLSRSDVDITSDLGKLKLKLPVISSNMKHVTGVRMPVAMYENGGLGIQHRFKSIDESVVDYCESIRLINMPENPNYNKMIGVSVGVKPEEKERFEALYNAGARIICIDVAHGHHSLVRDMIYWIKEHYDPQELILIAGNVATPEGAIALSGWGADIIKVGIGPGAGCMTRRNTGVGAPQFSALKDIRTITQADDINLKIIADGGIKFIGDFSKALIYADAVMVGHFVAGTSETPGKVYRNKDNQLYKIYGGSASGENKTSNGNKQQYVEGVMQTIPFKGHVKHILNEIKEGIQSAFSYSGAINTREFKKRVSWRVISDGSQKESKL